MTKRFGAVLRNILAAIALAAFGGYVLRSYSGALGLFTGGALILASLAIAFPTQLHRGSEGLRDTLMMIVPVIVDILPGKRSASAQQRATDTGTPQPQPQPTASIKTGTPVVVAVPPSTPTSDVEDSSHSA